MHVLITRPEADAETLKSRIEALGHRVSLAPMLEIVLQPIPADAIDGVSGLIITSRNGLRALAVSQALDAARKLPVFVAGPATAQLALELGFAEIVRGAGTAADLAPVIAAHPAAKSGTLVHLAGDHLAFDLEGALAIHGIRSVTLPAYRSIAAKTLPESVASYLSAGTIDTVILMSPRTAETWSKLVQNRSIDAVLKTIIHVCLSQPVAHALRQNLPQKGLAPRIEVAGQPNAEEILALVCRLAAQ